MKFPKLIVLSAFVFGLIGCGTGSSGEVERTYPNSFNFETISVQQMFNQLETPDSVNIEVFVFDIHECPEDATCVLPDRIVVSENLPPVDTLYITAIEPRQFKLEEQYQISLAVTDREIPRDRPDFRIIGYSPLKEGNN